MMKSQIDPHIYKAAQQTAVLVDRSALGMLKISGATRLDLINRMSTQAVDQLQSGEGAATILTTDIGRIIDRLILYTSSDTVYTLTGENFAHPLAQYLMRFVFFNDDFHLEDISEQTAVWAVYGPQASTHLTQAGFPQVDLPLHHWRQAQLGEVTAYIHRTDPIEGDGYFITCIQADKTTIQQKLLATGLLEADEAAFDFLRIAAGQPRSGQELTGDYIPLEANLWDDVSFHKGCYTGQEIIARMESRGQLAKQLKQLTPTAPIEAGIDIRANGKRAGTITSTAVGPAGPVALGYVKTTVLQENLPLQAGGVTLTIPQT